MVNLKFFVKRKTCPLCNSKKHEVIFSKSFKQIKLKEFFLNHLNNRFPLKILNNTNYLLSECLVCKIIYQNHILNRKYNFKYYNDYIDHEKVLTKKNQIRFENNSFKDEMKLINKIFEDKKINILEFGAGLGSWIFALKENNYTNISAVEISKKRRDFLKKNKINSYKDIKIFKKKKFDLIYADQVLEHLNEPGTTLKQMVSMLKKNGIIIIKIPSGFFLKKKLMKKYYAQKDEAIPLEHINIFTNNSLKFIENNFNLKRLNLFNFYKFHELSFYKYLLSDMYQKIFGKKIFLRKVF